MSSINALKWYWNISQLVTIFFLFFFFIVDGQSLRDYGHELRHIMHSRLRAVRVRKPQRKPIICMRFRFYYSTIIIDPLLWFYNDNIYDLFSHNTGY